MIQRVVKWGLGRPEPTASLPSTTVDSQWSSHRLCTSKSVGCSWHRKATIHQGYAIPASGIPKPDDEVWWVIPHLPCGKPLPGLGRHPPDPPRDYRGGGAAASPSRDRARRRRPRHAPPQSSGSVKVCACAGSQALQPAGGPLPGVEAGRPAAVGGWEGRRKEITGFPRPPTWSAWVEARRRLWGRPSARPSGSVARRPPPSARARAASPSVRPAVPARAIPRVGSAVAGASSTLPALPPATGLSGAEGAVWLLGRAFRQRRLCVHLGAPRAGRCLPASPESWAGRGRALPRVPGERRWDLWGPLLSRGLGFQDVWFRWMSGTGEAWKIRSAPSLP